MRSRIIRILVLLFTSGLVLEGCATFSRSGGGTPSWVTTTPPPRGGYTYFVGSGSDPGGNLSAANEQAGHSMTAEVTRYLGVDVRSQLDVQTSGDITNIATTINESVQESSSARVSDFTIVDRWIQRNGRQVTVFLLGRYATNALEQEKSRLAALSKEREAAVNVPEAAANSLVGRRRYYAAAVQYMHAADAAAKFGGENANVKFERNIKGAVDAVSQIRLTVLNDDLTGMVGKPLPQPFRVHVNGSSGAASDPLSGVPFTVSYAVQQASGRTGIDVKQVHSSSDGSLVITRPIPQIIGPATMTVALDMRAELNPLRTLPAEYLGLVGGLEQAINAVRVTLHYSTTSLAAGSPTGGLVMDLDRSGARIAGDDAASGVVAALTSSGYSILPIESNDSIVGIGDADLVTIVRNNYSSKIERIVIGQAMISSFEQSDGSYNVQVSGTLKVADLATGKILYSASAVKWSRASGANSAISAAFKGLGETLGTEIADHLR